MTASPRKPIARRRVANRRVGRARLRATPRTIARCALAEGERASRRTIWRNLVNAGAQRGVLARRDLEAGFCREHQVHGVPCGHSGCGLTPELSRSALRPRRCDNLPNNSAAAKRSRLERIVRPLATISALRTQMQRWQLPRARQQSSTRTFPSGCHPILRVHPGSPRIQPGSWSFHPRHK